LTRAIKQNRRVEAPIALLPVDWTDYVGSMLPGQSGYRCDCWTAKGFLTSFVILASPSLGQGYEIGPARPFLVHQLGDFSQRLAKCEADTYHTHWTTDFAYHFRH
jgi:hypothetical protein